MHTPCRGHGPVDRKGGKHMPGHDDAAVSETEHGDKDSAINDSLYDPQQFIFPLEQIGVPTDIQNIVRGKQHEHSCPKPLMKRLSGDLIGHQAEQQCCHQEVDPPL